MSDATMPKHPVVEMELRPKCAGESYVTLDGKRLECVQAVTVSMDAKLHIPQVTIVMLADVKLRSEGECTTETVCCGGCNT